MISFASRAGQKRAAVSIQYVVLKGEAVNWQEFLRKDGIGIMGTSDAKGNVNLAIWSPPRVLGRDTVLFGATHRVTYKNLTENPRAMFMYIVGRWEGIRMELELERIETEGTALEEIKEGFKKLGYHRLAEEIRYALYFRVKAVYPLKGR